MELKSGIFMSSAEGRDEYLRKASRHVPPYLALVIVSIELFPRKADET